MRDMITAGPWSVGEAGDKAVVVVAPPSEMHVLQPAVRAVLWRVQCEGTTIKPGR